MAKKNKAPMALTFTQAETLMLWQLVNAKNVATHASDAHVMAPLYAKLKAAAAYHGLLEPPADDKA